MTRQLFLYCDSIMKGVIRDEDTGQYTMYQPEAFVDAFAAIGYKLNNRSRYGATIDKGRQLIERDLKRFAKEREAGNTITVLLEFGGNDSDFYWDEVAADPYVDHPQKTPPEAFKQQYREIVQLLRDHDIEPILLNLPPIQPERFLDYFIEAYELEQGAVDPFIDVPSTIYHHQEMFSDMVCETAMELKLEMIDIRRVFLSHRYCDSKLIGGDGLHPTPAGHELIRARVVERMRGRDA